MSSTSEARIVVREKDTALICNEKLERGRCKKLIITEDGKLLCKNGHSVTVGEVWNAYLSRPDWDVKAIGHVWPLPATVAEIIKRIASPEFLQADDFEWQLNMVSEFSFLSWLIHVAENYDRKAAATLKDFRDKKIREQFPLLRRYFEALEKDGPHSHSFILAKERISRSLSRWRARHTQPEDYLAIWEVSVEAADYLDDEHLLLYRHNLEEAIRCVHDRGRFPTLYFTGVWQEADLMFDILLDPLWKTQRFFSGGPQIRVIYRHKHGNLRWYVGEPCYNMSKPLALSIQKLIEEHEQPVDRWQLTADDKYIRIRRPKRKRSADTHGMKPREVLEVLNELKAQLGSRNLLKAAATA